MRGCSCRGTAGFAHVSCLAEQAKILMDEAEYNNLSNKVKNERWKRWWKCGLCEQSYHGVVKCALGWACWKTYLGRPEANWLRMSAMRQLGNGLSLAERNEEAFSVYEAELSMLRRIGAPEDEFLVAQSNLANTYEALGRLDEGLRLRQDAYSGSLKLNGEEHKTTLKAASNYASSLNDLSRFEEARLLLRKTILVARQTLGDDSRVTLGMRKLYAQALYKDPVATLDDLHEAVDTLVETEQTARRVLGGAHPLVGGIGASLRNARAALAAREASAGLGALAL